MPLTSEQRAQSMQCSPLNRLQLSSSEEVVFLPYHYSQYHRGRRFGFVLSSSYHKHQRSTPKLRLEIALTKRKWGQGSGSSHLNRSRQLSSCWIRRSPGGSARTGTAACARAVGCWHSSCVPFPEAPHAHSRPFPWLQQQVPSNARHAARHVCARWTSGVSRAAQKCSLLKQRLQFSTCLLIPNSLAVAYFNINIWKLLLKNIKS